MVVLVVCGGCLKGVWKVPDGCLEGTKKEYQDQNENFYLELECGPAKSYLLFIFSLSGTHTCFIVSARVYDPDLHENFVGGQLLS